MTIDDIIAAYRSPLPTRDVLRAGVAHADGLAPPVYDLVGRLGGGECLEARDLNLLHFGLHVLAVARRPDLWPRLVDLARLPQEELEDALADGADIALSQMMLSAWDGDEARLLHLIEHADLSPAGRAAMFATLSRLTLDGRIPRDTTEAFLERYEREALADEDDDAWIDWAQAVTRLGLVQLEPVLHRVWEKPAFEGVRDRVKQEGIAALHAAAASPADPAPFDRSGIKPLDDAGDAVAWLEESLFMMQEAADRAGGPYPPPDEAEVDHPATGLSLSDLHWLERFLVSRQVPPSTMPLPMVDGYLTASAIGPGGWQPARLIGAIWGENGEVPAWRAGQEERVTELMARHWSGIRERRTRDLGFEPILGEEEDLEIAAEWAEGFLIGIEQDDAWELLTKDRRGAETLAEIELLTGQDSEWIGRAATEEERGRGLERLPGMLRQIARYWENPAKGFRRGEPVRVVKVGRNDPCPCGSGQKYKRCCGQNTPTGAN
jgi:uncharacterized protein